MKHTCGTVNHVETGSSQNSTAVILLHNSWWGLMLSRGIPPQDWYSTVLREQIGRLYIRGFFFSCKD